MPMYPSLTRSSLGPWTQAPNDGLVTRQARTIGAKLYEQVSHLDFQTSGRSEVEAINAAIEYIWRNNADAGGEVYIPPGAAISFTAPILAYPGVKLRGKRELIVPSWTHGSQIGLIHVDGVDGFEAAGFRCNTGRRCSPVFATGGATRLRVLDFYIDDCRSIFAQSVNGMIVRDLFARNGTAAFGSGSNISADVKNVELVNIIAEDMRNEAVDINYNTVGLSLTNFSFARCSTSESGETIDVGGGTQEDIKISNGRIDCGGTAVSNTVSGIKVKLGARNVTIAGVSIVNGDPDRSTCNGITLTECYNVDILGCQVDHTFARGFSVEPAARDFHWSGGKNDSPAVLYGHRGSIDYAHDGQGSAAGGSAVQVGAGAEYVTVGGHIRNRPGTAVTFGVASGMTLDCGIKGLTVENCRRAAIFGALASRGFAEDVLMREVANIGITFEAGHTRPRVRNITSIDGSTESPLLRPAVQVAAGCHGGKFNDITSIDTGTGAARTSGRALSFAGESYGCQVATIIGDGIAFTSPVSGTELLTNSYINTDAIYIVTAPPVDTELVADGYLDPTVEVNRSGDGLREGTDGIWTTVDDDLPRLTGAQQNLLIERSHTPILAARRDLTDAAWTKTNCTASKTAEGIDGVANSASTLTATGANGTAIQAVVLASAQFTAAPRLRRRTGTGTVELTMDGGATWPVTAVLTSDWTEFPITQTLANPGFGIRIVTSGDEIDVDYADIESRAFATSPVPDGAASRPTEVAIWQVPDAWPAARAVLLKVSVDQIYSGMGFLGTDTDGGSGNRIRIDVSGTTLRAIITVGGANVSTLTLGTVAAGDITIMLAWDDTSISALLHGGTVQTYAGSPATTQDRVMLGDATAAGTQALCGLILKADAFVTRPSDADMLTLAAAY